VRPFDIDLNERVRPKRADDDVALQPRQLFRFDVLAPGHLPHVAVVERELLNHAVAHAVDTAIADMADPSAFGP